MLHAYYWKTAELTQLQGRTSYSNGTLNAAFLITIGNIMVRDLS